MRTILAIAVITAIAVPAVAQQPAQPASPAQKTEPAKPAAAPKKKTGTVRATHRHARHAEGGRRRPGVRLRR
jgi:hypothetical protein